MTGPAAPPPAPEQATDGVGGQLRTRPFRPGDEAGIRAVMEASFEIDRIPGWTRHDIERAVGRLAADPSGIVVAEQDGAVVGYAILRNDDLTVHPAHRRRGVGRALVAAARAAAAARGDPYLNLYVPPHLERSLAFARAVGLTYRKSLWLLELGADREVPAPAFPAGVTTETWSDAIDVDDYVAFANASFEGHPTPLGLTPDIVRHVAGLPDFVPEGVLVLREGTGSRAGPMIGFTKTERVVESDGRRVGYVSQIGVVPAWRGKGLGRELMRWGIARLRADGADAVQLAVEAWNERALGLYRRTGFEPVVEWPHWVLPSDPGA